MGGLGTEYGYLQGVHVLAGFVDQVEGVLLGIQFLHALKEGFVEVLTEVLYALPVPGVRRHVAEVF